MGFGGKTLFPYGSFTVTATDSVKFFFSGSRPVWTLQYNFMQAIYFSVSVPDSVSVNVNTPLLGSPQHKTCQKSQKFVVTLRHNLSISLNIFRVKGKFPMFFLSGNSMFCLFSLYRGHPVYVCLIPLLIGIHCTTLHIPFGVFGSSCDWKTKTICKMKGNCMQTK